MALLVSRLLLKLYFLFQHLLMLIFVFICYCQGVFECCVEFSLFRCFVIALVVEVLNVAWMSGMPR
jgi:hypothetical protein